MSIMDDTTKDVVASAIKAAPPVSVVGMHFLGYGLAEWLVAVTLVYTILQVVVLLRDKVFSSELKRREEKQYRDRVRRRKLGKELHDDDS
jgi:hypothetical protein